MALIDVHGLGDVQTALDNHETRLLALQNGGSIAAVGDVTINSDSDANSAGDTIFQVSGFERARIKVDGTATGIFDLGNDVTVNELSAASYVPQTLSASGTEQYVWTAPVDCLLTGASLFCQGGAVAASDSNYWSVAVLRFRGIEAYYNNVLASTASSYWPLDEAAGTTATGVNAINSATMNVGSTTNFPTAGSFVMGGVVTTYTGGGGGGTTLTGCGNHAATTGGESIYLLATDVVSAANGAPTAGVTVAQSPLTGYRASYLFNGTTGWVEVANSTALDLGDGPFSIECWFKRAATGVQHIMVHRGTNAYALFVDSGDHLAFSKAGVGTICSSGSVTVADANPHYAVITKNAGSVHLYLDGVDVTTSLVNQTLGNNSSLMRIGSSSAGATPFNGNLDNVALYKRVLTAAEVAAHYAAGQNPGTVATKTTKVTNGEAIAQRADWNFDAVAFDASLRVLQKGDCVYFAFTRTGTPANLVNTGALVRYQPV